MTRIHHARPHAAPPCAGVLDQPRAALKKKKPYKVVLEAVTQEKKKLHSILTYADHAPPGFGFVPAGHPDFTEWCKEQCRQRNLDVHIVSAKPKNKTHADPEKLSHHVHRVGHHFPLDVITPACSKFGYTYDDANGLRKAKARDRDNWIAQQVENYSSRQLLHGRPTTEKETKDHTRGAVREMFPKIPEADLTSIVNHAFEEGTNRVGNAKELSLARRVQLAVVAHIRHTYTDYDRILKTGSWIEARAKVEHVSLAKLREWRDESGEQSNEIEDTFREVIVLDDEDTSDDEFGSTPDEREQSMEIVSSRVTARDIRPEHYPRYSGFEGHDAMRSSRRTIIVRPPLPLPAAAPPPPSYRESGSRPAYAHVQPTHSTNDSHASSRPNQLQPAHSRPSNDPRTRPAMPQPVPRMAPNFMRDSDGRLYELQPIDGPPGPSRAERNPPPRPAPRYAHEGYVQPSPRVVPFDPHHSRLPPPPPPPLSRRTSDQDTVIPSVEREAVDLVSSRHAANARPPIPRQSTALKGYADMHSPKRKVFPSSRDTTDLHPEQSSKKLRSAHYESGVNYDPGLFQADARRPAMNYQSMDARNQPRREVIDLTSSPHQSVIGDRGHYHPVHATAAPSNHPYGHAPARRSPPCEVRSGHYEGHTGGAYPSYTPDDRMYRERPPPAYDLGTVRSQQLRPRVDEERMWYLRSDANHRGHGPHYSAV